MFYALLISEPPCFHLLWFVLSLIQLSCGSCRRNLDQTNPSWWWKKNSNDFCLWQSEYRKRGFQEVVTPNIYNSKLWQTSGHWQHYSENMFSFEVEKEIFALKPMNCPGHWWVVFLLGFDVEKVVGKEWTSSVKKALPLLLHAAYEVLLLCEIDLFNWCLPLIREIVSVGGSAVCFLLALDVLVALNKLHRCCQSTTCLTLMQY